MTETVNLMDFNEKWQPGFLAMICPRCGDTMRGEPDSLVVICFNCDSCWAEEKGRYRRLSYQLIEGGGRTVYLPFWRIGVESEGIAMKTFADLLRVTNQPVVVREIHHKKRLEFLLPAMKIRPKVYITMAKSATLSQLKYPDGDQQLKEKLQPVTLPLKEAVQAIKSVFAETSVNRKDVMPLLPDISFTVQDTTLTYLPFEDTGHDYVQHHSALSVASSVVRFGRRL